MVSESVPWVLCKTTSVRADRHCTTVEKSMRGSENATDRLLATLGEIGRHGGIVVEFAIVVGVGQLKGGESIGDELEDAVECVVGVSLELLGVCLFALRVELHAG